MHRNTALFKRWVLHTINHGWMELPGNVARALSAAKAKDASGLTYRHQGQSYTVDFASMLHTNNDTNESRKFELMAAADDTVDGGSLPKSRRERLELRRELKRAKKKESKRSSASSAVTTKTLDSDSDDDAPTATATYERVAGLTTVQLNPDDRPLTKAKHLTDCIVEEMKEAEKRHARQVEKLRAREAVFLKKYETLKEHYFFLEYQKVVYGSSQQLSTPSLASGAVGGGEDILL